MPAIQKEGLKSGVELQSDFEDVRRQCSECILVLDVYAMGSSVDGGLVARPSDVRNLQPYATPRPVTAAGGFVTREVSGDLEILLIFRKGIWDLPKGKQNAGEKIEECARREVCEEVGIDDVEIKARLGRTIHGYRDRAGYAVKTTHWFGMSTDAVTFAPQWKERIEKVEWVRLAEAHERIGFETLRRHMAAMDAILRSAAADGHR